jgi:hypothetical protein
MNRAILRQEQRAKAIIDAWEGILAWADKIVTVEVLKCLSSETSFATQSPASKESLQAELNSKQGLVNLTHSCHSV